MARAVLGPLVSDLRGKLGNQVFDNYKGVHIVRAMPSWISNPQSGKQASSRAALAVFVKAWQGLTLAQKSQWPTVACSFIKGQESDARMNRGGLIQVPRGPFSGYNAFIALNMNRFTSGFSTLTEILEDAPIARTTPEPLKSFSAVVEGRTITASWEYINPGPLPERLEIWIKSVSAGIHPQLLYTEARNADGDTDITQAQGASGILTNLPSGVYQLQAMIVNQYGLTTAPSELVFVQIGAEDMFTYLTSRQPVLSLVGVAADVAATEIDMSAFIPPGAHSAIIQTEVVTTAGVLANLANFTLRKNLAQGDSIVVGIAGGHSALLVQSDEGIMQITDARKIEYRVFSHSGAPLVFNVEVFLLGYVS